MAPKDVANTVEHGSVTVPGKPTGDGDTASQPSDSGATSTHTDKEAQPSANTPALNVGEDAAKGAKFTAPATSALKSESSHMPGSNAQPHV